MILIRQSAAAKIAGLDRPVQINEWIATGVYSDAPRTQQGKPRLFGEDDLVRLCLYASLEREGMDAKRVDELVGKICKRLSEEPCAGVVTASFGIDGEYTVVPAIVDASSVDVPGEPVFCTRHFDIAGLRRHVRNKMDEVAAEAQRRG